MWSITKWIRLKPAESDSRRKEENIECSEPARKRCRKENETTEGRETSEWQEIDGPHINLLPYEILCKIFHLLYHEERLECALVCRRWYRILRSEAFQDGMRYNLSHCFGMPMMDSGPQYMDGAYHCVFDDCGSDPEPEAQAKVFEMLRRLTAATDPDAPGPSVRPAARPTPEQVICSSGQPLRTLEVKASFDRMRRYLGDRLKDMTNLQHLTLSVLAKSMEDVPAADAPCWTIEHPTLTSLTWKLFANTVRYELRLPALRHYSLDVANDVDLYCLMDCSEQLVELAAWFYFDRAMEQTLTRPFPLLRKLQMRRYDVKNIEPEPNTPGDDRTAEEFVKRAPLLEDLSIADNKVTHRIFRAVCLHAADRLKRLTVGNVIFPRALFLHITRLKNLEFLMLEDCILDEGNRLRQLNLPRLREVALIRSETCFRLDAGFAHVQRFIYSVDSQLGRLCRNMTMLEDLELLLRTGAPVGEFVADHIQFLPLLPSLRTLCFNGMKTTTRPWDFCKPMPRVEKLILRGCHLLRGNFALLPKLFPRLKVLELDGTIIGYRKLPDGVKPLPHMQRRLKRFLPRCCLVVNPACDAVTVDTMLEMEDEVGWELKMMEQQQTKVVLYGKQREFTPRQKRRWKRMIRECCSISNKVKL